MSAMVFSKHRSPLTKEQKETIIKVGSHFRERYNAKPENSCFLQ